MTWAFQLVSTESYEYINFEQECASNWFSVAALLPTNICSVFLALKDVVNSIHFHRNVRGGDEKAIYEHAHAYLHSPTHILECALALGKSQMSWVMVLKTKSCWSRCHLIIFGHQECQEISDRCSWITLSPLKPTTEMDCPCRKKKKKNTWS